MKGQTKTTRYAKISLKKRMKLVQLVGERKKTIAAAARVLGIKTSTAKLIVKRHRQEGTYFERKDVKIARIEKENQMNPYEKILQNINSNVLQELQQSQAYIYTQQPIFCMSHFHPFQNVLFYPQSQSDAQFPFIFPQARML